MRIVFEVARERRITVIEGRSETVTIGVGSHTTDDLHVAAYTASNGVWGAFAMRLEPHTCSGHACHVKTELLGLSRAIMRLELTPLFLVTILNSTTATRFLTDLRDNRETPSWDYSSLVPLEEAFGRLSTWTWKVGSAAGPHGTSAAKIAEIVHGHVRSGRVGRSLPPTVSATCAQQAEVPYSR